MGEEVLERQAKVGSLFVCSFVFKIFWWDMLQGEGQIRRAREVSWIWVHDVKATKKKINKNFFKKDAICGF